MSHPSNDPVVIELNKQSHVQSSRPAQYNKPVPKKPEKAPEDTEA